MENKTNGKSWFIGYVINADNYLTNLFKLKDWERKSGKIIPKRNSLAEKIYNNATGSEKRKMREMVGDEKWKKILFP